jgi:hypothetical protein
MVELRLDHRFLGRLQRATGVKLPFTGLRSSDFPEATSFAESWLTDVESEIGHPLWPGIRAQVVRYAAQRFPGLMNHFKGDRSAAEQTLWNILNTKFHELKPSSR